MHNTPINTEKSTDEHGKLLHGDLTYKIIGIIYEIRKKYGPGQKEIVYQNLLAELLEKNNIKFIREQKIKIYSEESGKIMGTYQPDFVIDNKIILETKSSRFTTKTDEKQLYHYLRNSEFEIGLLINFSTPQIYIKRIIYTNDRKPFLKRRNDSV